MKEKNYHINTMQINDKIERIDNDGIDKIIEEINKR